MQKIVYLTFNDLPGGIYSSQVIDVCNFLQRELQADVKLIAFISIRGFFANRRKIRAQFPAAIVLPMWPGIENWMKNAGALRRRLSTLAPDVVVARGPFATVLARSATKAKVCFDARGAYMAEFSEYNVGGDKISGDAIRSIEQRALTICDTAIAVSEALVNYWKREFHYADQKHVIIPCTLSGKAFPEHMNEPANHRVRIVFSGGSGKWQSLSLLSDLLLPYFETHPDVELLLLTAQLPSPFPLADKFPQRVQQKWVAEAQVHDLLAACDYGWLVREHTVTNEVASPVKFAEYLSAGLSVIISEGLGDFSEFVRQHACGFVTEQDRIPELKKLSAGEKARNRKLAEEYFTKRKYLDQYRRCLA